MSIAIKLRDYAERISKKLDEKIGETVPEFKGHLPPQPMPNNWKPICFDPLCEIHNSIKNPRELWLLRPDGLYKHWTVTDREPTSVGWIHVQVIEEETK